MTPAPFPVDRALRPGTVRAAVSWLCTALLVLATACASGPRPVDDPLAAEPLEVDERDLVPPPLRPVWTVRADDEALPTRAPLLAHDRVYLAYRDRIETRRIHDGRPAETLHPPAEPTLPPVALPDGVAVATADALLRLTPDLRIEGLRPLPRPPVALEVIASDLLIADDEGLRRIAAEPAWSRALSRPLDVVADDGRIFVTVAGGELHCLDAASGETLWIHAAAGELPAAPAIGRERVYAAGTANEIVSIAVADGRVTWRRRLGADVLGSPVVAAELVWVAGLDATLVAYTRSGSEVYRVPLRSRSYVELAHSGPWVVAAPQYGPWTLVRPATRRTAIEPGEPTVVTLEAEPEIVHPPVAAADAVVLVDGAGWITLLRAEARSEP